MKFKLDTFNILIIVTSFISIAVTVMYSGNFLNGYEVLILYPFIYLTAYILILQNIRYSPYPLMAYGIILMQWIRFILMPPIIALAANNPGLESFYTSRESLIKASFLIIYEFLFISLFSFIAFNSKRYHYQRNVNLAGNKLVYIIFILMGIFLLITIALPNNLVSFFFIPIEEGRIGDTNDTLLILVQQVITLALMLTFLVTVNKAKKKYKQNKKRIYIIIAILAAILNVSFIVGERRTSILYSAIITIYILINVFPQFKKNILLLIGLPAIIVLGAMSIYKFFGAFLFASYNEAIVNSEIDFSWLSETLQSYFFGPKNIAMTIEFSQSSFFSYKDMLFDFLRSTFGINNLLKDIQLTTSQMYNMSIYGNQITGHVISSVAYGYIYFGFILSPLIASLNIFLGLKAEGLMNKSKSLEFKYIWGYVTVRFCTNLFVNTPPLISASTIMIGTGGLLFFVSQILGKTSSSIRHENIYIREWKK